METSFVKEERIVANVNKVDNKGKREKYRNRKKDIR